MSTEQEIRRCGGSWACCDGNCEECPEMHATYSNKTESEEQNGN